MNIDQQNFSINFIQNTTNKIRRPQTIIITDKISLYGIDLMTTDEGQ